MITNCVTNIRMVTNLYESDWITNCFTNIRMVSNFNEWDMIANWSE